MKFAVAIALCTLVTVAPARSAWVDEPLTHVLLANDAPGTAREFIEAVDAAGGHVAVLWPAQSALVHADAGVLARPEMTRWITRADVGAIDVASLGNVSVEARRSARTWNALLAMRAEAAASHSAHDHPEDARGMLPDARHVPVPLPFVPERRDAPDHIPYGAEYYDTSTFLAGTTAVGVWLLEAAGSTYDWSVAEEDQTLAGVASGLARWVAHGGALASLSFVVETHTGVPVSGVPIENPQSSEQIWIGEALTNAGWSGSDAFQKCFAYNNSIRDLYETNWCYSYFIVDSDPAVNQGLFSTGGYAWSYYGGPWVWMSRYSSWAYNAANYFEAVPEHEMGHTFYATDEYDGLQQFSGYLNRSDNINFPFCLMNQNSEAVLCVQTQRQLAWTDPDANGIMTPLDVEPSAALDELLPDPIAIPAPTWTGRATVNTLNNMNPNDWRYSPAHDVTISTIASVECRVDGGAWTVATPLDGTFDGYGEDFAWTSPPLADGVHVVEARAQTDRGLWSTIFGSDEITVGSGTVGAPVLVASDGTERLSVSPNPARSDVVLAWRAPAGPVRLTIFDAAGRRVFERASADSEGRLSWNGRGANGAPVSAGVYLVQLRTADSSTSSRLVLVR